jgi:hypothetical protein
MLGSEEFIVYPINKKLKIKFLKIPAVINYYFTYAVTNQTPMILNTAAFEIDIIESPDTNQKLKLLDLRKNSTDVTNSTNNNANIVAAKVELGGAG